MRSAPASLLPRRAALLHAAALAVVFTPLEEASAGQRVKGAAEMDLEFYARGLLGQKTSPSPAAQAPVVARALDAQRADLILRAIATGVAPALAMSADQLSEAAAKRRSALAIEYDRVLAVGAFGGTGYDAIDGRTAASQSNSLQFGFDLSAFAYFSLLADARLPARELSATSRRLGDELLRLFPAAARCTTERSSITALIRGMRALLAELQAGGFIASFSIDDSDADEALWQQRSALSPTKLTVTLTDSATLRAALLLNGRGVSPELTRPLLVSYLTACGARVSEESEYFLDDYRESPLEYRPSQSLLSLVVAPMD